MASAFASVRAFFGSTLVSRSLQNMKRTQSNAPRASLTARKRRRMADIARINLHREIKRELDENGHRMLSAFVSIPNFVRERCKLNHRTARVKIFVEQKDLSDIVSFRDRIHSWMVRLFPELEQRGLLRASHDFDMRVGGTSAFVEDSAGLQRGVERCQKAGSAVHVELIPHNLPPPTQPFSRRVQEVAEKARSLEGNCDNELIMVSFFKFTDIPRPDALSTTLLRIWRKMGITGRVYVAKEGINAQLAVPQVVFEDFRDLMKGSWYERGEPYVPAEIAGVHLNVDRTVRQAEQPFRALHVRPKGKILADGFKEPLDWERAGDEVSPMTWHKTIRESSEETLLLDCRNDYESNVGMFEGAEALNTRTFRETWDELERRLENVDRGRRILTYCTGGIRCVKVNAFLEQKMGFKNTGRLQGGIVSYAKELREAGQLEDSAFKGVNHVFDGRMGETITEDLLGRCINCDKPSNKQIDCANVSCHRGFEDRIFVQCPDCTARLKGACSEECHAALPDRGFLQENFQSLSEEVHGDSDGSSRILLHNESYAEAFSFDEDSLLQDLRERTEKEYPNRFQIMSSRIQAGLLQMLVQISRSKRVLEVGTFTGYATLAMARALPPDGVVVTCEVDEKAAAIATKFAAMDAPHGAKVQVVVGRADKYIERLVTDGSEKFDFIFVDANKGGYVGYARDILDGQLLKTGGIMVFDNVLFRGEVADIWKASPRCSTTEVQGGDKNQLPSETRSRKTAQKLHDFNHYLKQETRLRQLVLPLRDGLTIAQRVDDENL